MALTKTELTMLRRYLCDTRGGWGIRKLTPARLEEIKAMSDTDVKKMISDYKALQLQSIDNRVAKLETEKLTYATPKT